MPENSNRSNEHLHPIRHTAAIHVDVDSEHAKKTELGEDIQRTSQLLNGLGLLGIDFISGRSIYIPRIVAGIKSERTYRRQYHRYVEDSGHDVGQHLKHDLIDHENASAMLQEFAEAPIANDSDKTGLELGHIELSGAEVSSETARIRLNAFADRIAEHAELKTTNARHLSPSHLSSRFSANVKEYGQDVETKIARARTNFPVYDIGKAGIQLFVRVAVGYEYSDRHNGIARAPLEVHEISEAHTDFMANHVEDHNIVKVNDTVFAYPVVAALVALRRNNQ